MQATKTNLAVKAVQLVVILLPFRWCLAQSEVVIDQALVATATITDRKLIDFFVESFLIPEEQVEKIQFIDATGNGFGEEDLIKCFPSEKTYYLFPSEEAQKVMNQWQFTSNFQSVTQVKPPEIFEQLQSEKAQNWILAGLLRSLNWHYNDKPMKIYFAQDSTTITFEMWGYNSNALQWKPPPPPPKVPETTYDLVHLFRSDTLIVADTTYYDLFYLYRTVRDTVYVSGETAQSAAEDVPPELKPGLITPAIGRAGEN